MTNIGYNGMGMDPFVVFPAEWAAAGFEIHTTPPTLPFPSGYTGYRLVHGTWDWKKSAL